ncbi:NAD(P)-dependent alcohol dehydrogenase [Cellulomonas sp. KRMCY2]|uniref:NAD(P)-dependent alcohol dehydrogenase n=1 Tax=Cellulomonas sp. KRMCY2 TaxID=1304865 RepID=UPI0012DD2F99|nr:NAD(P)-dependent alcohol dehydrogenase [Cellulomonas sp. KRMCY2]
MTTEPLPRTMTASVHRRYGPPEVLHPEQVPVPAPRPGEVLVRVGAVAASAADAALRAARPAIARLAGGLLHPRNPILGSEVAGVVVALGEGVTAVAVGERVVGATGARMGGYAECVCLRAVGIARVPDGLTLPDAVGVTEGGLTALPFLRDQARLLPGQRVLINGASGCVGAAAVQLAADLGAEVVGVCSGRSAELVRSLGATEVIDYTAEDFTAARGAYDVVFDTVATSSFRRCRRALRPGGVYLTTAPSPVAAVQSLLTRGARRRVRLAFTGLRPQADKAADMTVLIGLAVEGRIRPVVDRTYPLADAAEAHRLVDSRHKRGTVVLVP